MKKTIATLDGLKYNLSMLLICNRSYACNIFGKPASSVTSWGLSGFFIEEPANLKKEDSNANQEGDFAKTK
jgi:hypothetical protein